MYAHISRLYLPVVSFHVNICRYSHYVETIQCSIFFNLALIQNSGLIFPCLV